MARLRVPVVHFATDGLLAGETELLASSKAETRLTSDAAGTSHGGR
jgi:hypothetical protein